MGLNCGCPAAASISAIPVQACSESLGQVQKVIFQRVYKSGIVKNLFDIATDDPKLLASWAALKAVSDGSKIAISPYVQGPTNEVGGPRKFGGGNATLGGIEIIIGRDPSKFSATMYSINQIAIIKAMKELQCEELGVFFVDENGRIAGIGDSATPTEFSPIPIRSLFIGDKKLGGTEEPDSNSIEFSMMPNWSDNLVLITPTDFNPLTDL